jgi:hypothetical protein
MSALEQYIAPFILCCLIVAAAVQAIKQVTWLKLGKERPAPLRHIWRLSSLCIGAVAGLGIPQFGWYEGLAIGCGAGVLSTSTVAYVQGLIEKRTKA